MSLRVEAKMGLRHPAVARAAAIGTGPLRPQATRAHPDLARATTGVAATRVRNSTCGNLSRSRVLPRVTVEEATVEEVTEATTARRATPEVVAATVEADRTARLVPVVAIPRAEVAAVAIPPAVEAVAGTRVVVTTKPTDAPHNFVRAWF